jgi:hypothetical protein
MIRVQSARSTADAVNVWVTVLRSVLGALKLVSARPSYLTLLDASLISAVSILSYRI